MSIARRMSFIVGILLLVIVEQSFIAGFGGERGFPLHLTLLIIILLTAYGQHALALTLALLAGAIHDLPGGSLFGLQTISLLVSYALSRVLFEEAFPNRRFRSLLIVTVIVLLANRLVAEMMLAFQTLFTGGLLGPTGVLEIARLLIQELTVNVLALVFMNGFLATGKRIGQQVLFRNRSAYVR